MSQLNIFDQRDQAEVDEPIEMEHIELIAQYQALVVAIQFFEPMGWQHPALQSWLKANQFGWCRSAWQLPPAALWVVIRSLQKRLERLKNNG